MAATGRAIEVGGLRDLRRDLRRVQADLPGELADLNQRVAGIVAAEASRRAPRGPHQGGGDVVPIHASIKALRLGAKAAVSIGGRTTPHGVVTEFGGTIPRRGQSKLLIRQQQRAHRGFERAGLAVTRVRKQAYLYPALDAKRDEAVQVYGDGVAALMRRAFGSGVAG